MEYIDAIQDNFTIYLHGNEVKQGGEIIIKLSIYDHYQINQGDFKGRTLLGLEYIL